MKTIDDITDISGVSEQNLSASSDLNEVINSHQDVVGDSHKAGFVNIVGNPNVGKSTLMKILAVFFAVLE